MPDFNIDGVIKSFDVRAYDVTRSWGLSEWDFALSRRRMLVREPDIYRQRYDIAELVQGILETAAASSPFRPQPAHGPTVSNLGNYAAWGFKEIIESRPDIAAVCAKEGSGPPPFKSEHEENSEEWIRELFEHVDNTQSSDLLFDSFNKLLVEGPFESDTAYVEVFLSAPDEVIVEDFRKWLLSIRQDAAFEHSPVKRFTETEIRRWSANQVLPFLDLRLAAWAAGTEIPYHTIGGLLFPGLDVDVAEKARKVTAPLADELMTWELGEALHAAASAERRSGRKQAAKSFRNE
jgi:hypothetical protein